MCYRENTHNHSPIQSMLKYLNTVAHTSGVELGNPRPARVHMQGDSEERLQVDRRVDRWLEHPSRCFSDCY
jgi:hypothetical protein